MVTDTQALALAASEVGLRSLRRIVVNEVHTVQRASDRRVVSNVNGEVWVVLLKSHEAGRDGSVSCLPVCP